MKKKPSLTLYKLRLLPIEKINDVATKMSTLIMSNRDKEMFIDFDKNDYNTVEEYIEAIIYNHNYIRPSYALNYKTPIEYRTQLGFN